MGDRRSLKVRVLSMIEEETASMTSEQKTEFLADLIQALAEKGEEEASH